MVTCDQDYPSWSTHQGLFLLNLAGVNFPALTALHLPPRFPQDTDSLTLFFPGLDFFSCFQLLSQITLKMHTHTHTGIHTTQARKHMGTQTCHRSSILEASEKKWIRMKNNVTFHFIFQKCLCGFPSIPLLVHICTYVCLCICARQPTQNSKLKDPNLKLNSSA